jgi:hypothetical protein
MLTDRPPPSNPPPEDEMMIGGLMGVRVQIFLALRDEIAWHHLKPTPRCSSLW